MEMNLKTNKLLQIPRAEYSEAFKDDRFFIDAFKNTSDDEWRNILIRSAVEPEINGVNFPAFPDIETQSRIHGSSSIESSIGEAYSFYKFVRQYAIADHGNLENLSFLDYGCGWGRILRPYLRDIKLSNIFAYEPSIGFCLLARKLNPYVNILNGDYLPDNVFPSDKFDLIVGWSIFSHLTEKYAKAWLKEFSRILKKGGKAVLTTWGLRFLERLEREQKMEMAGEEIHWYSRLCLSAIGTPISERINALKTGEFVWFSTGNSDKYGEAFLPQIVIERWIKEMDLPLGIVRYDSENLAQDCFVLERVK